MTSYLGRGQDSENCDTESHIVDGYFSAHYAIVLLAIGTCPVDQSGSIILRHDTRNNVLEPESQRMVYGLASFTNPLMHSSIKLAHHMVTFSLSYLRSRISFFSLSVVGLNALRLRVEFLPPCVGLSSPHAVSNQRLARRHLR